MNNNNNHNNKFVHFERRRMHVWRISCPERITHETYSQSENLFCLIKSQLLRVKSLLLPSNHKPVSHCECKYFFYILALHCVAKELRSLGIGFDTCTVSFGLCVLPYKPQTCVRQSHQTRRIQCLCFYKNYQTPHDKMQKKSNKYESDVQCTIFLLQIHLEVLIKEQPGINSRLKKKYQQKANEVGKQLWNDLDIINKSLKQL